MQALDYTLSLDSCIYCSNSNIFASCRKLYHSSSKTDTLVATTNSYNTLAGIFNYRGSSGQYKGTTGRGPKITVSFFI